MLPSKKTDPIYSMDKFNWIVYGQPGIGKSTFASQFENPLFIPTEPGLKALSVFNAAESMFSKDCITSWDEFLLICAEIIKAKTEGKFPYSVVIIDTADRLYDFCTDYVVALSSDMNHPSDIPYGVGYKRVTDEWRRVISKLISEVRIVFIEHEKLVELTDRAVKFNKITPSISNKAGQYLNETVTIIGYVTTETVDGKEERIIRFRGDKYLDAKDNTTRLGESCKFDYKEIKLKMEGKDVSKKAVEEKS